MIIHNITIRNFKSLYGEHYFDFDHLNGLIKFSGVIGSGKTSIGNALCYALFGSVEGTNNKDLISWNAHDVETELNLTSKGKEVYIKRNIYAPLYVTIDGKPLSASSKRDTQQILEQEIYDVSKMSIMKMCIISFNQFSNSLAKMNPGETRQFLDQVFGFKLFSDYNNQVVQERKSEYNEMIKFNAIKDDYENQIESLKHKKEIQKNTLNDTIDIDKLNEDRKKLLERGVDEKNKFDMSQKGYNEKISEYNKRMTELSLLGKQERQWINTFKSGICPTCHQPISEDHIKLHQDKIDEYTKQYLDIKKSKEELEQSNKPLINQYNSTINDIKKQINAIDSSIKSYKDKLKIISDNYDELIMEYEEKLKIVQDRTDKANTEITQWDEMSELFSKTLRYNLLDTLIPHINKSIQFFINKLEQPYTINFDQEFKSHITIDGYDNEISYSSLSTGQKKTLDLAIIFGILQNIIVNADINVLFLDELFSNMDADMRNIMLSLIKETMINKDDKKSIWIINHAEMNDDYFDHKIRVKLENYKMTIQKSKKTSIDFVVKASKYEQVF